MIYLSHFRNPSNKHCKLCHLNCTKTIGALPRQGRPAEQSPLQVLPAEMGNIVPAIWLDLLGGWTWMRIPTKNWNTYAKHALKENKNGLKQKLDDHMNKQPNVQHDMV